MSNDKPNILFIVSDQHSPFVTGCYGNPNVRTPNLDALAEEGVVFESAYCAVPICVPSRLSMLSGRHSHNIGVWSLSDTIRSDTPTFPIPLTIAGWPHHDLRKDASGLGGPETMVSRRVSAATDSPRCGTISPYWNLDEVPRNERRFDCLRGRRRQQPSRCRRRHRRRPRSEIPARDETRRKGKALRHVPGVLPPASSVPGLPRSRGSLCRLGSRTWATPFR